MTRSPGGSVTSTRKLCVEGSALGGMRSSAAATETPDRLILPHPRLHERDAGSVRDVMIAIIAGEDRVGAFRQALADGDQIMALFAARWTVERLSKENLEFLRRFRALLDEYPAAAAVGEVGDAQRGLEIVSCPSCGRAQVDVYKLADEVTAGLEGLEVPLRVAVTGRTQTPSIDAVLALIGVCAPVAMTSQS